MITKEKHFTKCETSNSCKIIEERKYDAATQTHRTTANGVVEAHKGDNVHNQSPTVTDNNNKMDDNKVTSTTESKLVNGNGDSVTDEKPDSEDSNNPYGAPKYGTVIPNRIFVGGFSAKTADEDLWRFFSSFCHITAAKIIYDRAGVSKCYGFVTFANPKDAKVIVKQHGGVMHSPMGRLRIAQAVRKQVPMFPADMEGASPPTAAAPPHYYHPHAHPLQHKGPPHAPPLCIPITTYIPITQNHKYPPHPPPTQSVSPHGSSSVTPESTSTGGGMPLQQLHQGAPMLQAISVGNNNNNVSTPPGQPQGKMVAVRYVAPPTQLAQHRPPSVPAPPPPAAATPMYATPQGGMMPQYVIPTVAYPQTLPAYDATGLYTTCPGYTTYPYVMMAPPREYASYPHPTPHMGAMMPTYHHPAQPQIMNSYIY